MYQKFNTYYELKILIYNLHIFKKNLFSGCDEKWEDVPVLNGMYKASKRLII